MPLIRIINLFKGDYSFLSNFYYTPIEYEGLIYKSSEVAYQASKTLDMNIRKQFTTLTSYLARRSGKNLNLRDDWFTIRKDVMYKILQIKFSNPFLRDMLIKTNNAILIEGNDWGDTFWGVYKNKGENNLGLLLMKLREEIKK